METAIANCQSKLTLLLQKFLDSQIQETYIVQFLTLLQKQEETEVESTSITLPILTKWVKQAVTSWSASRVTPQPHISSFILRVTSLLSKNEDRFCSLNSNNFFIKLVNVAHARHTEIVAVKSAYLKLLSSFLEHTPGIEWMIACNFWEDALLLTLSNQNEEIVKESTRFLSKLLEKTVDFDENFCSGVIKRIMLPLGENIYKSLKSSNDMADLSEEVASQYLRPTLRLIGNILEYFLEGIHFGKNDFQVVIVFLKNFHLEERISDFMMIAQAKCLFFDVSEIMFIIQFLELYVKSVTNSVTVAKVNATVLQIKHNFVVNMSKGTFESVLVFCNFGQLYGSLIDSKIQIPRGHVEPFATQLIGFYVLPYFCLLIKYLFEKQIDLEESGEFREVYIRKLFYMIGEDVLRVGYWWRDHLLTRGDLFKICIQCSHLIKDARKYFSREAAIVMVQSFFYTLSDVVRFGKEFPIKLEVFRKEEYFFWQVFDILTILIEEFEITWKDTLETIDLLAIAFDFLMIHRWPVFVVVQVLKLIKEAIAKYMAPNLALLLDTKSDSAVTVLGPILFAKLYEVLEVKIAALEVVCTVAQISSSKFPSLQKVLMDSELPTLVVKMSACDGESFVRATAIKCLQEMIQVEEIWNNALKSEDLSQKMRDILLNETEGIVRVEAATFMCVAYENQQLPKETLDKVYETMIYSSTTDLHWEVKVRALDFWDKVIKNHLQNQGMIDGSFPNVTFSKEHRKIVTLTDSEIRKRLLKVLSQLSAIGCLGVLMSAIKDDCDMEVSKTAVKITQRLVDLFKKYNVRSDSSAPTSPTPTENGTISMSSGISVDESMDSPASSSNNHQELNEEIIDQIVNSKDVSLLKNVYTLSDYGSVSNYDIQVRKIVTPNEFLQFTQQDLNNIITEKKKWLNGIEDLGSLLDDMLKTYDDDVNNMDCY